MLFPFQQAPQHDADDGVLCIVPSYLDNYVAFLLSLRHSVVLANLRVIDPRPRLPGGQLDYPIPLVDHFAQHPRHDCDRYSHPDVPQPTKQGAR